MYDLSELHDISNKCDGSWHSVMWTYGYGTFVIHYGMTLCGWPNGWVNQENSVAISKWFLFSEWVKLFRVCRFASGVSKLNSAVVPMTTSSLVLPTSRNRVWTKIDEKTFLPSILFISRGKKCETVLQSLLWNNESEKFLGFLFWCRRIVCASKLWILFPSGLNIIGKDWMSESSIVSQMGYELNTSLWRFCIGLNCKKTKYIGSFTIFQSIRILWSVQWCVYWSGERCW